MGKKDKTDSTIENRVYLFKDLAAAYLQAHGGLLSSPDHEERSRARRALADIAYVSCVLSDTEQLDASGVAALVAGAEPT